MESSHLLALLIIAVAVIWILAGLSILIRRGAQAARGRVAKENEENVEAMIQWKQLADRSKMLPVLDMAFVGSVGSKSGMARFVPVFNSVIADPVDGTVFQQGETVIRCACGTNYHQHSWEWIGEKNQGKCVSCKRTGLISTYMC
jgi:hypothetical protein